MKKIIIIITILGTAGMNNANANLIKAVAAVNAACKVVSTMDKVNKTMKTIDSINHNPVRFKVDTIDKSILNPGEKKPYLIPENRSVISLDGLKVN